MPIGNQFAQITHAAGESSPGNLPSDTHAVVLHAENEQVLLALAERMSAEGLTTYVLIREPDAPFNGAATAIGLVPQARTKQLKKLFSGLQLAKG